MASAAAREWSGPPRCVIWLRCRDLLPGDVILAWCHEIRVHASAEGTIEIQTRTGATTIPVGEVGYFPIRSIPDGPFRLHCHTTDGSDVLTGWITL